MHNLKPIRERLGVTQRVLAEGIGCTQGNIGHYERGQDFPPDRARLLIDFAGKRGLALTFDHVYGNTLLPELTEAATA
jgi:putative transcriptional regulator